MRYRCLAYFATTLIVAGWCGTASAYRPFDSTDAAVANPGEFEIELGPAGFLKEDQRRTLVAPAFVLNLGIAPEWEVVAEGRGHTPLEDRSPDRTSFIDDQVSLKGILREGSLQDKEGPSVAAEVAVLLPEVHGASGAGVSLTGIVSQRWAWGTLHVNGEVSLTRDQHADVFFGTILEGPSEWKVRPVAEVFYERDFSESHKVSGLVGAIWQLKDNLAADLGFRHAWSPDGHENEVRLGLTFSFRAG